MADVFAIDPGNQESAFVLIDGDTCRPRMIGYVPNGEMLAVLDAHVAVDHFAIEMIASYGMAVGADVFETCVWIGRFAQVIFDMDADPQLVKRHPVKMHHCHSAKAKDSNISQALVDRFASAVPNRGKGSKAEPGWFYGFAGDIWQAYALAVYVADLQAARQP